MSRSELPKGWETTAIKEICLLNPKHSPDTDRSTLVSFVPMQSISESKNSILPHETRPLSDVWTGYTHFAEGDVLFAKITPCMENGKTAVARNLVNGMACGSTEFFVLRPEGSVSPEYIHSFLRRISFRRDAEANMTGVVGQRRVPREFLETTEIPLAPSGEQHRIIKKIEALMTHSRRAKEVLDAVPILLDRYRQSVLAAAFRGDLTAEWRATQPQPSDAGSQFLARVREIEKARAVNGRDSRSALIGEDDELRSVLAEMIEAAPLPIGWEYRGIGQAFGVYVGATPSRKVAEYWNGDIPWVSSGEVNFCRISDTHEKITANGLRNTSTRIHPPGTVMLGMIGEGKTRGQVAILDVSACNNQNCAAIRVSESGYPPEYLYWYLLSVYEKTRTMGGGNNQPALNKSRVQKLPFPLAPVEEAKEIVKIISRKLNSIPSIGTALRELGTRLANLDQSILDKAFRGELVPQDPNDEPASVLLERIRRQREAAGHMPRKRRSRV